MSGCNIADIQRRSKENKMKYMGSKNRIAKHLLPIMLKEAEKHGITKWVEPFVGGGGMIDKVPDSFERAGYDLNPHTIQAMLDIRDDVDKLPETVTEEEYKSYKGLPPQSITSWVRFVCSFGGKFEDGYAREREASKAAIDRGYVRNFAAEGKRNALKQTSKIQNVQFVCASYEELDFKNCLIYCDIPYKSSTGYKTGEFDYDKFYVWCRNQAKKNVVFVSEYEMPDDFECVWQGEIKTNFASNRKKATHNAVEKLFKVSN